MIVAALVFTVMVACVKIARLELTALEIVLWRSASSIPLAWLLWRAPLVWSRGESGWTAGSRPSLRLVGRRWFVVRLFLGFGAMLSFFTAARGLDVADLSLVSRLQPLVIVLLAPVVLGRTERSGGKTWGLLLLGLLGCAVLLGPELAVGSAYGAWALAAVLFSAAAHVCLRALGPTDDPRTIVLWFQCCVTVLALVTVVVQDGGLPVPPRAELWPAVLGVGALATLGQVIMTRAYALDRAAVVSAASHVSPLWAVGVDLLVFSVWPDGRTLLGGVIVLAAALGLVLLGSDAVEPVRPGVSSGRPTGESTPGPGSARTH
jgi:drug/metabolite transporter (DMT)-like permease